MPISSSSSLSSQSIGSITDKAAQFISNIQSKFERRNAIRNKVTSIFDHRFEAILLKEPTFCSQCRSLIWGLVGHECKLCKLACHKGCLDLIEHKCTGTLQSEVTRKANANQHKFKPAYFLTPTFCYHCGILIKGIASRQGLECDLENGGCGMAVHFDCKLLATHQCCKRSVKILPNTRESATRGQQRVEIWSKICIEDFELMRLLGIGSFSKVYLARFKLNRQEFAIKVVKKTNLAVSSDPESALTEMRVLNLGRQYPFLTIAHCCFQSESRLYYVMEHVVGRDLVFHLSKARKFTEDRTRFYSAEIVLALRFLHKQGVVYRDLKLDNVILDQSGHCKLLDFGMSKELCKAADLKTRTFCGTPSYMSPEIIKELNYGFSVDWWALGVLMFEMLIGYSPFEAQDEDQLYRLIVEDEVRFPLFLTDEARCILEGLLTKDPQNRLGCHILEGCEQAILEHPFFLFKCGSCIVAHQWEALEAKRIKPPYRPTLEELDQSEDGNDVTSLTPIDSNQLKRVTQAEFNGFSFYSESFSSLAQLE